MSLEWRSNVSKLPLLIIAHAKCSRSQTQDNLRFEAAMKGITIIRHTASLGRQDGLILAQVTIQAQAFRRGLDEVKSADINPSRRTNDAVCIFSYEYLKSNWAVTRRGESARWAHPTIRLIYSDSQQHECEKSPVLAQCYVRVVVKLLLPLNTNRYKYSRNLRIKKLWMILDLIRIQVIAAFKCS